MNSSLLRIVLKEKIMSKGISLSHASEVKELIEVIATKLY